ncbi:PilC/PilY family type IV pilus protein [Rhodanobacter sp. MP1X3]|uniref:pilus assembly protein n=1 Tax=Rhodanobacter sp. MP1X3 TaxID=2723086 RepID=UPI001608AD33|nr:PilC/PilY family type IV pilus protein [Rhodanobacter sp. MP1X3]MBB6244141.1 type IV pilus assembly protein PilY1 [Rhodanobacter sp. MP1X3]
MRSANSIHGRVTACLSGLVMTLAAGFSGASLAGTVDLSTTPPEASTTVAPNLVLTFDDSGSMNWHHSPDQRPYTGAGWNTASDTDQSASANITYRSQAGPYLCAGVITPGITDPTDPRAWSMNGVYFNPDNTYAPPLKADGTTAMPDSSYTKAWDNGIQINRPVSPVAVLTSGSSQNTRDLSSVSFCGKTGAGYYKYNGTKASLPLDAKGQLNTTATNALYTSGSWTWVALTSAADQKNFANWYSYYRTRTMAAVTAISRAYAPFDKSVRVAWQNINSNNLSNSTAIYKFVDDTTTNNVRTKFYNWLFATTASGGTPNRSAAKLVGTYFTNRTGAVDSNPYWDRDAGKELVCRQNFHIQMTDGMWNGDTGITLPATSGNDTANISLPDGRPFSTADKESGIVWNEVSNSVVTMADLAFYYWSRDLQAGVSGTSLFATQANRRKVASYVTDTSPNLFGTPLTANSDPRDNKEIFWNPVNDPASWPHLVQYMIGFGASGSLANNDTTYASLRKGGTQWPAPVVATDDGKKIDDMWHAALNSRGQFFAANSPSDLIAALTKIISSIVARSTTAVAASLSTSVLGPAALTYQAGYDTNDWTGTLTANQVNSDGTVSTTAIWNGRDLLDTRARAGDTRVILTSTGVGTNKGTAFSGTSAVNVINAVDSNFGTGTAGADRLAWLRGNQSKEGTSFRQRNHILGAVMNAQVLYVTQPASGYRNMWPATSSEAKAEVAGTGYAKFQSDHATRAPTIYVAANDGMLHAFDASAANDTYPATVDVSPNPGRERWAYVPYSAYGRLTNWSALTNFSFQPSVDGTPVSRDVYFGSGSNSGWHTILVAGLRYGGRGVYALDITDASASESSPGAKVLWEFNNTSTGGANLGYTFGRPNIGRLASGQWVVLVPGGYLPSGSTDAAASNNFSSLFVLDAQTGALIREIKTPTTVSGVTGTVVSYGLTTPVLGDYQGDQIDDVAFAGDLQGNIWRFDLTGSSTNWSAELFFRSSNPGDRPVTVMPRLFADPIGGGLVVVFGTGKYLASADNVIDSNTKQQAVYGIRDSGQSSQAVVVEGAAATPLVAQTLTEKNSTRGLTTNAVPVKNPGTGITNRGWYFNLYINDGTNQTDKGERVVVDATSLSDTNHAVITTLIPQDNDPCDPAPRGAVMFLDAATGGAASGVDFGSISGWPSGFTQAGALVKNPPTGGFLPVATAVGGGQIYLPGLTLEGGSQAGKTPSAGAPIWRRRSWRVLNNDQ